MGLLILENRLKDVKMANVVYRDQLKQKEKMKMYNVSVDF